MVKTAKLDDKKVFVLIWRGRKTFVMYEPCNSPHHPHAKFQVQLIFDDGRVWQIWYEPSEPTVDSIKAELTFIVNSRKRLEVKHE